MTWCIDIGNFLQHVVTILKRKKDLSCFVLIGGNHQPFNRLALNESIETRSLPTLTHVLPPISTKSLMIEEVTHAPFPNRK
jgi:hypothetical protein